MKVLKIIVCTIPMLLQAQVKQSNKIASEVLWIDTELQPYNKYFFSLGGAMGLNLIHKSRYYKIGISSTEHFLGSNTVNFNLMTGIIASLSKNLSVIASGGVSLKRLTIYTNNLSPYIPPHYFNKSIQYALNIPLEVKLLFGKHAGLSATAFLDISKNSQFGFRLGTAFGQLPTFKINEAKLIQVQDKTFAIKTGFTTDNYGALNVSVEKSFNQKHSITASIGTGLTNSFGTTLGYRYYAIKNAGNTSLSGIYITPQIQYGISNVMNQKGYTKSEIGASLSMGYQRVFKSRFLFDINAGLVGSRLYYQNFNYNSLSPKLELKIGYAF